MPAMWELDVTQVNQDFADTHGKSCHITHQKGKLHTRSMCKCHCGSHPQCEYEMIYPDEPGGLSLSYIEVAAAPSSENITTGRDSRIPGNKAIWVGIFAEFTEFTLMFLVYFIARINHPQDFHEGPQKLSVLAGSMNTVLMVTSSFFVARAIIAMRAEKQAICMRWLVAALITAAGYPLVKFVEIRWNVSQGLTGGGDVFLMSYYYLTFNHLVHVSWGILGMAYVMVRTRFGGYSAANHDGLVAFASYWHATDLIWLMIFPLFYVLP